MAGTENGTNSAEKPQPNALDQQIQAHEDADKNRSWIGYVASQVWRGDRATLADLKQSADQVHEAEQRGDKDKAASLLRDADRKVEADKKAVDTQNDIAFYASSGIKMAALMTGAGKFALSARGLLGLEEAGTLGTIGMASTVGLSAADNVKVSDDAANLGKHLIVGGAQGLVTKSLFNGIGSAVIKDPLLGKTMLEVGSTALSKEGMTSLASRTLASAPGKGMLLDATSRGTELAFDSNTYHDQSGKLDLGTAAAKLIGGTFDLGAMSLAGTMFGLTHSFANALTGGAAARPFYHTLLTSGTLGISGGIYGEIQKEQAAGQRLDWIEIGKRGLLQGAVYTVAGVPGGLAADAAFRRQPVQTVKEDLSRGATALRNEAMELKNQIAESLTPPPGAFGLRPAYAMATGGPSLPMDAAGSAVVAAEPLRMSMSDINKPQSPADSHTVAAKRGTDVGAELSKVLKELRRNYELTDDEVAKVKRAWDDERSVHAVLRAVTEDGMSIPMETFFKIKAALTQGSNPLDSQVSSSPQRGFSADQIPNRAEDQIVKERKPFDSGLLKPDDIADSIIVKDGRLVDPWTEMRSEAEKKIPPDELAAWKQEVEKALTAIPNERPVRQQMQDWYKYFAEHPEMDSHIADLYLQNYDNLGMRRLIDGFYNTPRALERDPSLAQGDIKLRFDNAIKGLEKAATDDMAVTDDPDATYDKAASKLRGAIASTKEETEADLTPALEQYARLQRDQRFAYIVDLALRDGDGKYTSNYSGILQYFGPDMRSLPFTPEQMAMLKSDSFVQGSAEGDLGQMGQALHNARKQKVESALTSIPNERPVRQQMEDWYKYFAEHPEMDSHIADLYFRNYDNLGMRRLIDGFYNTPRALERDPSLAQRDVKRELNKTINWLQEAATNDTAALGLRKAIALTKERGGADLTPALEQYARLQRDQRFADIVDLALMDGAGNYTSNYASTLKKFGPRMRSLPFTPEQMAMLNSDSFVQSSADGSLGPIGQAMQNAMAAKAAGQPGDGSIGNRAGIAGPNQPADATDTLAAARQQMSESKMLQEINNKMRELELPDMRDQAIKVLSRPDMMNRLNDEQFDAWYKSMSESLDHGTLCVLQSPEIQALPKELLKETFGGDWSTATGSEKFEEVIDKKLSKLQSVQQLYGDSPEAVAALVHLAKNDPMGLRQVLENTTDKKGAIDKTFKEHAVKELPTAESLAGLSGPAGLARARLSTHVPELADRLLQMSAADPEFKLDALADKLAFPKNTQAVRQTLLDMFADGKPTPTAAQLNVDYVMAMSSGDKLFYNYPEASKTFLGMAKTADPKLVVDILKEPYEPEKKGRFGAKPENPNADFNKAYKNLVAELVMRGADVQQISAVTNALKKTSVNPDGSRRAMDARDALQAAQLAIGEIIPKDGPSRDSYFLAARLAKGIINGGDEGKGMVRPLVGRDKKPGILATPVVPEEGAAPAAPTRPTVPTRSIGPARPAEPPVEPERSDQSTVARVAPSDAEPARIETGERSDELTKPASPEVIIEPLSEQEYDAWFKRMSESLDDSTRYLLEQPEIKSMPKELVREMLSGDWSAVNEGKSLDLDEVMEAKLSKLQQVSQFYGDSPEAMAALVRLGKNDPVGLKQVLENTTDNKGGVDRTFKQQAVKELPTAESLKSLSGPEGLTRARLNATVPDIADKLMQMAAENPALKLDVLAEKMVFPKNADQVRKTVRDMFADGKPEPTAAQLNPDYVMAIAQGDKIFYRYPEASKTFLKMAESADPKSVVDLLKEPCDRPPEKKGRFDRGAKPENPDRDFNEAYKNLLAELVMRGANVEQLSAVANALKKVSVNADGARRVMDPESAAKAAQLAISDIIPKGDPPDLIYLKAAYIAKGIITKGDSGRRMIKDIVGKDKKPVVLAAVPERAPAPLPPEPARPELEPDPAPAERMDGEPDQPEQNDKAARDAAERPAPEQEEVVTYEEAKRGYDIALQELDTDSDFGGSAEGFAKVAQAFAAEPLDIGDFVSLVDGLPSFGAKETSEPRLPVLKNGVTAGAFAGQVDDYLVSRLPEDSELTFEALPVELHSGEATIPVVQVQLPGESQPVRGVPVINLSGQMIGLSTLARLEKPTQLKPLDAAELDGARARLAERFGRK